MSRKTLKLKVVEEEEPVELIDLQDVVLESSAQFNALSKLYTTNSNYKVCEQDENRVGMLDCEIILAEVKRMLALQCPMGDDSLKTQRQTLLEDALEQVDSAEQLCSLPDNGHYFGQAQCCMIRGEIYAAQTHPNPVTSAELAHNLQYLASVKEQWTHALSIFDDMSEVKFSLHCKGSIRRLDEEVRVLEAIDRKSRDEAVQMHVYEAFNKIACAAASASSASGEEQQLEAVSAADLPKVLTELGVEPALEQHEVDSIISQMGYDPKTATDVAWDNFWLWWCAGEVALEAHAHAVH